MARRIASQIYFAPTTAEFANTARDGQSDRAQVARLVVLDDGPRDLALVYAIRRELAEHGRINSKDFEEESFGWRTSPASQRDHPMAGRDCRRMEQKPNSL